MSDRVKVSVESHVAQVIMTRADKMNALDIALIEALVAAGEAIAANKDVRAVVLYGEGKGFCAGLDLGAMANLANNSEKGDLSDRTHGDCNIFQRVVMIWRDLAVPVIAAVHGVAFGGGFQLMLGADLRIIAPDAKLSVLEVKWGLTPDMGGTILMRELARDDVIRELVYTGRTFQGVEAKELGFATFVDANPIDKAMEIAAQIAALSPHSIKVSKALLTNSAINNRAAQLLAETNAQRELIAGTNHKEAVMAGLSKTKPVFS